MPDRLSRASAIKRIVAALLAGLVLLAALAPATVAARDASTGGRSIVAAAPGDDPCDAYTSPPGVSENPCVNGGAGGGGGGVNLLIIGAGVVLAGGVLALVVAYLVLRRRASGPFAPVDPGEWWTCRNCGKSNVVGSPRCFACASWQA